MPLTRGTRLGSYEILSLLGSGGMGEVYRAKDLKLGRDVAIKVLPEHVAADAQRLRRFEQEARAASALNHPNIIHIYDIDEQDGTHYIAMEYVEGKTVRELIGHTPLTTKKLLQLATQMADGLAKAHAAGIVHRDLKPENLMVTGDGFVKILDFGLAKLMPEPSRTDSEMATMTKRTQEGVILGTVQYMSPQQAAGRTVDYRSDQFSLGSILYEMATGKLAFQKDTAPQTQAAIIGDEPEPIARVSPQTPAHLAVIVSRCLAKEPEERYDSTRDLARELKSVQEILRSEPITSPPHLVRPRRAWLAAAAILTVAVVGAFVWWPFTERTVIAPDTPLRAIPLTSFDGVERDPALSPDGEQVAFVWNGGGDGYYHLYVKLIGGGDALQLTKASADDYSPAWSPNGREIAFLREVEGGHEVLSIPALGGLERRLGTSTISTMGVYGHEATHGLDWSPDGQLLALVDTDSPEEGAGIFLLSRETGSEQRLTSPPEGFLIDSQPAFSPHGGSLAFIRRKAGGISEAYVQPSEGGKPSRLTFRETNVWGLDWTSDGKALVVSLAHSVLESSSLWKVFVEGGDPSPLPFGENTRHVSVSESGGRLTYSHWVEDTDIWRVDGPTSEERGPATKLIFSTRADLLPQYSPDGRKVAFVSERSGSSNIWVCDSDGENAYQLTREEGAYQAKWSSSGQRVAFHSFYRDKGASDILVMDAKGAVPSKLTEDEFADGVPSWSADERWIYFNSSRTGEMEIYKITAEGGELVQLTKKGGWVPVEGGRGQFVYYTKVDPSEGIWRVPVDGGQERPVLKKLIMGADWGLWMQNIVYINQEGKNGPSIEIFDLTTRETTELVSLGPHTQTSFGLTVSRDGRWILYTQVDVESDIMLVENFR